ncbi:hypothetical protein E2P81_ATG08340 [Venturia nashicola]|uniref:Uncharacterized protein n=1 Tax=Venturia nashicola TaxID=86259 RepID=A0A4Z1P1K2_9PEZI|nr:hypothetical protein E6O75_ATG08529 [Venturia nashicola]TLD21752.1 hypothetical protein E2P81_ATG08340 [Venturia nashicola]
MKITAILALAFAATAIAQNTAVGDLADLEANTVKARAAAVQIDPVCSPKCPIRGPDGNCICGPEDKKRQLADENLVRARAAVQDDMYCGPGCYMMSGGCECLRKKEKRQLTDLEETNLVEARAVAIQTPPEKRQLADENLVIARAAVQDGYGCGPGCFRATEGCICLRKKEKRELAGLEKKNVVEARDCPKACFIVDGECYCGKKEKRELAGLEKKNIVKARDCPPSCFPAYGECYCGKKEKRELAGLEKKNVIKARRCPPGCFPAYGDCYCGKKEKRELAGLEEENLVKSRDIAARTAPMCEARGCIRSRTGICNCHNPKRQSADLEERNVVKARVIAPRLSTHCTKTCMRDINYRCDHCYQTPEPERRSADPEEKNLA